MIVSFEATCAGILVCKLFQKHEKKPIPAASLVRKHLTNIAFSTLHNNNSVSACCYVYGLCNRFTFFVISAVLFVQIAKTSGFLQLALNLRLCRLLHI